MTTPGSTTSTTPSSKPPASTTSDAATSSTAPSTLTPEQLITLLADEQRIQAESKARVDSYKALISDLYDAKAIGDNVSIPGFSLTRVTRTTYAYDLEVEAQIESLKSMARIDGQATEKKSVSWTLRTVKPKDS